jgi:hypothetical protein
MKRWLDMSRLRRMDKSGIARGFHRLTVATAIAGIASEKDEREYESLMTKRKRVSEEALDVSLRPKQRKPIPHAFVLEEIASLSPYTRPMFGCLAIYVKDKIMLILRDKSSNPADNGVWLATTLEHHQSLRREFPNMRSIQVFGKAVTAWQVLPVDAPDFESAALRACEMVLAGDPRIGKVPEARRSKSQLKAGRKASKRIS